MTAMAAAAESTRRSTRAWRSVTTEEPSPAALLSECGPPRERAADDRGRRSLAADRDERGDVMTDAVWLSRSMLSRQASSSSASGRAEGAPRGRAPAASPDAAYQGANACEFFHRLAGPSVAA